MLWFNIYSRGNRVLGSSGFEHIFLHEISESGILGFHNWIYFHDQQQNTNKLVLKRLNKQLIFDNVLVIVFKSIFLSNARKLTETFLVQFQRASVMKFAFSYDNVFKPAGSMFVGTAPEFDMALYTLCIAMDWTETCPISLDGQKFSIRSYSFGRESNIKMIASGFPDI